eukprot:434360-Pyramimonas_sp.AAC.1
MYETNSRSVARTAVNSLRQRQQLRRTSTRRRAQGRSSARNAQGSGKADGTSGANRRRTRIG